jgi:hypothetical protein
MEARMWPDKSPIVKCPKCARLFWLAKAKQLATIEIYTEESEAQKWEKTPQPLEASEQELLAIPRAAKLTRDEQMTVCRRAWWLANDRIRNNGSATKPDFSAAQVRNLQRLSSLLNEQEPGERICKAEIARELGQFPECKRLLSEKLPMKKQEDAEFIRSLGIKNDPLVRQFP